MSSSIHVHISQIFLVYFDTVYVDPLFPNSVPFIKDIYEITSSRVYMIIQPDSAKDSRTSVISTNSIIIAGDAVIRL